MDERVVYVGASRTIEWAVMPGDKIPALKEWNAINNKDRAKLMATIAALGDTGCVSNPTRFRHEHKGIFAIKAFKIRIYCFMTKDARIVLTNIDTAKKQNKASPLELGRADRIRNECLNA